ncbi:MAG: hypothetical protein AB4038_17235 [Prochloraceae cyanobacterium]
MQLIWNCCTLISITLKFLVSMENIKMARNFKNLKLVSLSVFGIIAFFSFPSHAQQTQSFSSCVIQLDRKLYIDEAIENCKQAFRGRPVNEDYSTCVEALDTEIYVDEAIEHCNEVFQNAATPSSTPSSTPTPTPTQSLQSNRFSVASKISVGENWGAGAREAHHYCTGQGFNTGFPNGEEGIENGKRVVGIHCF